MIFTKASIQVFLLHFKTPGSFPKQAPAAHSSFRLVVMFYFR